MVNLVLWRKLFRDLLERWGSILALVVIVAIGVGMYGAMAAVYRDLHGARDRYYSAHQLADFSVDLKRAPVHVLDEVAAMPNVRAVRGRVQLSVRIDLPTIDLPVTGTAISMPERQIPVLNGILLRRGTWFSEGHEKQVILDDAFAAAH
ncbi:ABC transporter permease, partial [Planctomycetota bacterium]